MTKSKTTQPVTTNVVQGRDLFQTPNYATRLLIPFIPKDVKIIWEPACGEYKITNILKSAGYTVESSDLKYYDNFFTIHKTSAQCIITNPPFSSKQLFYKHCLEFDISFALLIPADYSGWIIRAIRDDGCEKVIPTRRIDYITPTGKSGLTGQSSNFHSLWLTRGFNLGQSETFAELTSEMKKDV